MRMFIVLSGEVLIRFILIRFKNIFFWYLECVVCDFSNIGGGYDVWYDFYRFVN